MSFFRCLLLSTLVVGVASKASAAGALSAFITKHCAECHSTDSPEGGLDLTALSVEFEKPEIFAKWVRIHDRVAAGEMPPPEESQPSEQTTAAALGELSQALRAADLAQQRREGRGKIRRLNRVEHEQTLRDLLALPGLKIKDLLPEDGQKYGFDKVAGGLEISHIQMSKYLQVADLALRQAIVRGTKAPETTIWHEPAARQDTFRSAIAIHNAVPLRGRELAPGLQTHIVNNPQTDYGNTYRAATFDGEADSVAALTGVIGAHQPEGLQIDHFHPPVGGWYRVKFSVWGLRWDRTHAAPAVRGLVRQFTSFGPPYFQDDRGSWQFTPLPAEQMDVRWKENTEFYGEGEATHIVRASVRGEPISYFDAPSLKPTQHEFKVWLNLGDRVSFHAMTLPGSGAANGGQCNGVRNYEGPAIAYDWFEVEGPLVEQWPSASQRRLFGETPLESYARPAPAEMPAVEPGKSLLVNIDAWRGVGQNLGETRYVNQIGASTALVNCVVPGEYELVVTAYETPAGNEPTKMRFSVDGRELPGDLVVDATEAAPKTYRAKFSVESPGPTEIGIAFLNDYLDKQSTDPIRRDRNLLVSRVEIIGPTPDIKQASNAFVAPDISGLLASFAERAFRRPVAAVEIAPYEAIVNDQLKRGENHEEALIAGYKAILCAPDFLFVGLEPEAYALASRLSYFLWNSLPDDVLLRLAKSGEITKPEVLRAQVERMLADSRSERFVEHFLDEWLELKKIDFTMPDPQLYPEFDPWLRDSMLSEVRAFFRKLLADDLGISHLIASDFATINQRLAELYQMPGINGAVFRAVKLPEGSHRGGFLTQAAVLKVTANGTATSPVLRGVWINERLLGIPRDPPPPNIPAVEPDATGAVTIRQMIEKHRADKACASCHAKMDPPGMALESFDAIGGFRDRYRISGEPGKIQKDGVTIDEPFVEVVSSAAACNRVKLRLGTEVDSSGELADGRKFQDVDALRKLLLANEEQLARNLVTKLMIYATGDEIRFSDRDDVEAVVANTREGKYGLRSLLQGVVASRVFRDAGSHKVAAIPQVNPDRSAVAPRK